MVVVSFFTFLTCSFLSQEEKYSLSRYIYIYVQIYSLPSINNKLSYHHKDKGLLRRSLQSPHHFIFSILNFLGLVAGPWSQESRIRYASSWTSQGHISLLWLCMKRFCLLEHYLSTSQSWDFFCNQ